MNSKRIQEANYYDTTTCDTPSMKESKSVLRGQRGDNLSFGRSYQPPEIYNENKYNSF